MRVGANVPRQAIETPNLDGWVRFLPPLPIGKETLQCQLR